MKIKEGYLLRTVAGSNIVVPVGEGSMDFSGVIQLNDVGAFLWKILENGSDSQNLVSQLLKEYDVDEATAKNDVEDFLNKLREAGLVE
ncbi:MAG: PqqD family protein [Firmicutes bacterium]|nr:PqqD family protein [Bacillota bacterium]